MSRHTDVLIVGQGICGTFLSWWLERAGVSHRVIDESRPFTASKTAAGVINPVTGRRIVKTWMIDELLPFVREVYRQIDKELDITSIHAASVVDFFPNPQMRLAFLKRYDEDPQYLQCPAEEHGWDAFFRYELGYGVVDPCYLVDLPGLLASSRKRMLVQQILLEERFEEKELVVEGPGVLYKDISAKRVIFCDGIGSFTNPYFSRLPFAPNKGEALIVDIPGLRDASPVGGSVMIFKKGISLAPWHDGLYWVGSSYEWSFEHEDPTDFFRKRTETALTEWLKLPFRTVEQFASVRPATLERRPFAGFHPLYPAVGILNGMGTKGCSLAPYFAYQLVQHMTAGSPILPDADIRRFSKVLSKA
jgi:glycine/D-amino acid oxidase-like deaminating enzyme